MSMIYNVFSYMFGSKKTLSKTDETDEMPPLIPVTSSVVKLFYNANRNTADEILHYFANAAAKESLLYTMKTIAYIRNVQGERDLGRKLFGWLQKYDERQLIENMPLFLNKYGRYDDLVYLPKKSKAMFAYLKHLGEQLEADHVNMGLGKPVSLAAKWIPTETSAINKKTALTFRLARAMKVPISTLRKKYITPLRAYIGILENKMCANDWQNIDYGKLPAQAFLRHTKAFEENDKERFEEYKKTRIYEKETVSPHEIIAPYLIGHQQDELIETKWADVKRLQKTVVLSDVSLSMTGVPMLISSTLGLLSNRVLSFDSNPQFVELNGATLYENFQKIRASSCEENTNICGALKNILDNMKDAMPDKLIIVSDKQLNKADSLFNQVAYNTIENMFKDAGCNVPQIVYWHIWNVKSKSLNFENDVCGISVVVSGFSIDVLQCIMNNELPTQFNVMMNALNNEKFDDIREVV